MLSDWTSELAPLVGQRSAVMKKESCWILAPGFLNRARKRTVRKERASIAEAIENPL